MPYFIVPIHSCLSSNSTHGMKKIILQKLFSNFHTAHISDPLLNSCIRLCKSIYFIQEAFTQASKALYVATKHRAYFKQIKILIPPNWNDKPNYQPATLENINEADVVITHVTSKKRSIPTTRSYGGCGRQGIQIIMTARSVVNPSSAPINNAIGKDVFCADSFITNTVKPG